MNYRMSGWPDLLRWQTDQNKWYREHSPVLASISFTVHRTVVTRPGQRPGQKLFGHTGYGTSVEKNLTHTGPHFFSTADQMPKQMLRYETTFKISTIARLQTAARLRTVLLVGRYYCKEEPLGRQSHRHVYPRYWACPSRHEQSSPSHLKVVFFSLFISASTSSKVGICVQTGSSWSRRHTCASWWHLTRTTTSLSGTKVLERWRISQTILLLFLNLTGSKSRWRQLNHVFAQPSHHAVQHLSLLWPVHRVHAALLLPSPVVFR